MIVAAPRIAILGAGTIGCYLGAEWAAAGVPVRLIGRERLAAEVAEHGLATEGGATRTPGALPVETDTAALGWADLIVLCVKSTGLAGAIDDLRAADRPDVPVLCLLNGLAGARALRVALPRTKVLAGMVPYNVVWSGPGRLRRTGKGEVTVEQAPRLAALATAVAGTAAQIDLSDRIEAVQYGKLLLNLNNAVNALSGRDLHTCLSDRGYRRIFAAAVEEAVSIYDSAGVAHDKVAVLPAPWMVRALRAPDAVFHRVFLPMQKIGRGAQSSMAVDLAAGRMTEVSILNGEIVALAKASRRQAPVNAGLERLVKAAEGGGRRDYSAAELARELGL